MTKEQKNVDQMMEDFLSDNHVEDQGFSQQVMNSMPQQPRLIWITSLSPLLAILVGAFSLWKFDVITPEKAIVWLQTLSVILNVNVAVSATISFAVVIGVTALLGFFVSEKIKDM